MSSLRQDKMTMDERWVALLSRKPVDRIMIIPLALGYAGINAGDTLLDFYTDITGEKAQRAIQLMNEQYGFGQLPWMGADGTLEFGGEIKMPSDEYAQAPIAVRHGVNSLEEAWELKSPPDFKTSPALIPMAMNISQMEVERGASFVQVLVNGPWDVACRICGIERLCKWAVREPETVHHLLRLAVDFNLQIAQHWVETFSAESVFPYSTHAHTTNQIIGPKIFEEFCLPYIKEEHEKMLTMGMRHIMTHVCGYQALNYAMWAQIPMGDPGIVSVAHDADEKWPTPLESVCRLFPNDVIMGNIEPAIFQTGTAEQVYEIARQCIDVGKNHEPGFILAPGCELPPHAPSHNVWQMAKAVSDYGWYA